MKKYTVGNAHQELGAAATKRNSAHMLPVTDWLSDLPENTRLTDLIEVQFKNTRKGYFHNSQNLLGARSAVFLPIPNIGLVIMDEEHEPSYKQTEPAPRYHARAAAIMLAKEHGACTLLGTATPSVESYYLAKKGTYGLVQLTERFGGVELPQIRLVDLKKQYERKEMYGHFSDPLVARIRETLAEHKQVILFQNRRGYAPQIQCASCGQPPRCVQCDVPLTLHLRAQCKICRRIRLCASR